MFQRQWRREENQHTNEASAQKNYNNAIKPTCEETEKKNSLDSFTSCWVVGSCGRVFIGTIVSSKEWNFMLLVYRAKSEVRIRQSGNIFVMLNLTRECWTRISNIRKEKEKKRAIKKCRNKNEWKESISNISCRILCELRKPDRRRAAEIIKKKSCETSIGYTECFLPFPC